MSNWWNEGTKQELIARARFVAQNAYCPYSKFRVGASGIFLNEKGHHAFHDGCNIENASYGLTICAERSCIFAGISTGYTKLVAIAVCCPAFQQGMNISLTTPCGACRQVMSEFAIDKDMPIYIDGVDQDLTLRKLLPYAFALR